MKMTSSLDEWITEIMKFCPLCGFRLTKTEPPASCDKCGWKEKE